MIRTAIFITAEQRDALATLSRATGNSAAAHIRRAIQEYLTQPMQAQVLELEANAAQRKADGVPFAAFENVESTLFTKILPAEQQAQIAAAPTDLEKRRLLRQFINEAADQAERAEVAAASSTQDTAGQA